MVVNHSASTPHHDADLVLVQLLYRCYLQRLFVVTVHSHSSGQVALRSTAAAVDGIERVRDSATSRAWPNAVTVYKTQLIH